MIIIVMYLDDGWTIAASYNLCFNNMLSILSLFTRMGFLINVKKSSPQPSTCVKSLGFNIDSVSMTVFPAADKIEFVINFAKAILIADFFTIPPTSFANRSFCLPFSGLSVREGTLSFIRNSQD